MGNSVVLTEDLLTDDLIGKILSVRVCHYFDYTTYIGLVLDFYFDETAYEIILELLVVNQDVGFNDIKCEARLVTVKLREDSVEHDLKKLDLKIINDNTQPTPYNKYTFLTTLKKALDIFVKNNNSII